MSGDGGERSEGRSRAEWFLAQVSAGAEGGVSPEEFAANVDARRGLTLDEAVMRWRWWAQQLGPEPIVEGVEEQGDTVRFRLRGVRDRLWWARFSLVQGEIGDEVAGSRLADVALERRLPEGIEVRDARPEDGPAIAELYRSTPIEAGDIRVLIDPGDDYFATTRLMEESSTLVATERGKVIGVYCGTLYGGAFRGEDVTITLGCHSRMAPGKAGGGVWSTMNNTLLARFEGRYDVPLAFVLTGNAAASRLTMAGAWPAHPVRALIACSLEATTAREGRPSTPADAAGIVELVNATFAGQDLFRPLTIDRLKARLERAPDLYSWEDVWITDRAVVGIGRVLQGRRTDDAQGARRSTRALVFDYGVGPGHLSALRELLAARGADAARRGATHLSVFTTAGAPAFDTIMAMADETEAYDVLLPRQQPDDDAATRGIYVDQVHF